MSPDPAVRRYPLVAGVAALRIPFVTGLVIAGALLLGSPDLAVAAGGLGWIAHSLRRGVVVEVSPSGLTRGFVFKRTFRGRSTVLPWDAVAEINTEWSRPGDDTALRTLVRDDAGRAISFSTAMGLRAYWACLAAVVKAAPDADRSGITDAALMDGPPTRRDASAAVLTAGVLALILAALVGFHWLLAQGPSTLSRSLEQRPATSDDAPGLDSGRDR